VESVFLFPIGKSTRHVDLVAAVVPLDDGGCSLIILFGSERLQFFGHFILRLGVIAEHGTSPSEGGLSTTERIVGPKKRYVRIAASIYWHEGRGFGDRDVGDREGESRRAKLSYRGISPFFIRLPMGDWPFLETVFILSTLRHGDIQRSRGLWNGDRWLTRSRLSWSVFQLAPLLL
jgi:hypothetical protein